MNADSISRRQALRITAVAGLTLGLGGGLTAALLREAGLHRVRATRGRMGTVVTLTVVHPEAAAARQLVEGTFLEMERLESILSRHRDTSALSRLNRDGILGAPPPELLEVVDRALELARLSSGAFDPTVAPLLGLHRRTFADTGAPPSTGAVRALLPLVDHRGLDRSDTALAFHRPGMALTLDGVAKGFIVDRSVALLSRAGAERILVDAGGDMASAFAGPGAEAWMVAVQDPRRPSASLATIALSGGAIATSGDYMDSFTPDRRHHHILDPRTGFSPEGSSGVTVLASTAMDADALSTAAFVLGVEEGPALLAGLGDVEGLFVTRDGRAVTTPGWARHQRG